MYYNQKCINVAKFIFSVSGLLFFHLKIAQPDDSINKEYFEDEEFLKAFKKYIETITIYLNGTNANINKEIIDLLELSKKFSTVSNQIIFFKIDFYLNSKVYLKSPSWIKLL